MTASAPESSVNPTLLALATVTRYAAQRLTEANYVLLLLSALLSCGALVREEEIAWALVTVGFLLKISSFFISAKGRALHSVSREAQRLALLEDSYGQLLENFQVVEVRKRAGYRMEAAARRVDYTQPYYTSTEPRGNARLRASIQQSSFWSRNLLELYGRRILVGVSGSALAITFAAYVLLVLAPTEPGLRLNPYVISLGALTLVLATADHSRLYLACRSAVSLLLEVDRRLDKVDIKSAPALLANFADYSVASVLAPPIPLSVYLRNHEYLRRLWAERVGTASKGKSEVAQQSTTVPVEVDEGAVPPWLSKATLVELLQEAAADLARAAGKPLPGRIEVARITSLSGTPVFDIKVYQGSLLWRELILRLLRSVEDARKELAVVERITNENVDVIAYCPFREPYISRGALFYYHANIQTNDQLFHIHDFVVEFLSSPKNDFDSYFMKMLAGFRSVCRVYEGMTDKYGLRNVADELARVHQSVPPSFVLDLRRVDYRVTGKEITAAFEGRFPSADADTILASPVRSTTAQWIKNDFEVLGVRTYSGDVYEIDIALTDGACRVLVDTGRARGLLQAIGNTIGLQLIPAAHLVSLAKFAETELGLNLASFSPLSLLERLRERLPRRGLYSAFRHRDLHTMNCLVSRSNFKVVDVGDSGEAMICADIARLELSLLARLAKTLNLTSSEVERLLAAIEGPSGTEGERAVIGLIARIVRELRRCFEAEFRTAPTDIDWALAYYEECCQQVSYSISSPLGLSGGVVPVIWYWQRKLEAIVQ